MTRIDDNMSCGDLCIVIFVIKFVIKEILSIFKIKIFKRAYDPNLGASETKTNTELKKL